MIFVFPFIKNLYSSLASNCCVSALLGPVGGVPEVSRLWWAPPGSEMGSPAVSPLLLREVLQPIAPFSWRLHSLEWRRAGASPVALCDSLETALPSPDLGLEEGGSEYKLTFLLPSSGKTRNQHFSQDAHVTF